MDHDELKPPKRHFPMQGVEIWKNKKNRFCIVELHYTADPAKRAPEFKQTVKASMPLRQYEREYELSWETWAGLPVYEDWDTKFHGVQGDIDPHMGLPLLRGWDFGLTPAAIICQLQEEQLCVLKEYVGFNIGLERFSEIVLQDCQTRYPMWGDRRRDWMEFIDPSGEARKDTDEGSCAKILDAKGLNVRTGAIAWTERKESVEHFLTRRSKKGPCLRVSLDNCPTFVRGFKGGYQYPDKVQEIEPSKLRPLKNEFSHIHDAFQMVTSKLNVKRRPRGKPVPANKYSFQRGNK